MTDNLKIPGIFTDKSTFISFNIQPGKMMNEWILDIQWKLKIIVLFKFCDMKLFWKSLQRCGRVNRHKTNDRR